MANNNDKGPKFTGGDKLEGLYKLYHEAMMKSELYDGYGRMTNDVMYLEEIYFKAAHIENL